LVVVVFFSFYSHLRSIYASVAGVTAASFSVEVEVAMIVIVMEEVVTVMVVVEEEEEEEEGEVVVVVEEVVEGTSMGLMNGHLVVVIQQEANRRLI
jgi:hypothetical protein